MSHRAHLLDMTAVLHNAWRRETWWERDLSPSIHSVICTALVTGLIAIVPIDTATAQANVYDATLAESNQSTPEISTGDLRRALTDGSAVVIDARKHPEFVAGHIAGAKSTMYEGNPPPAASIVPIVESLVGGDKSKTIVLYCNGPHCAASRRLGEQLVAAGFPNVRRYQLGMPLWRTLNGPVEIELEGILRVYKIDRTAVFLDSRSAKEFSELSLPGTSNLPADLLTADELAKAPLPHSDFNTRIVLFGRNGAQARALADALAKTPFQNVSYFPGTFDELLAAVKGK
jgi:rhodanese-related sulfurtransferase